MNSGQLVSSNGGAFKTVDVYEFVVTKQPNLTSEEDVDDWYDSDVSVEECYQELENEFYMVNKFKHMNIFPPIIDGTPERYTMRRAEVLEDAEEVYSVNYGKKFKIYKKSVHIAVIRKLHQAGMSLLLKELDELRIHNLVLMGFIKKVKVDKLALSIYKFLLLHGRYFLLSDARTSNVGFYKGNVVMIDAGQVHFRFPRKHLRHYIKNNRYNPYPEYKPSEFLAEDMEDNNELLQQHDYIG